MPTLMIATTKIFALSIAMLAAAAATPFILILDPSDPYFRPGTLVVPALFLVCGLTTFAMAVRYAKRPVLEASQHDVSFGVLRTQTIRRNDVRNVEFDGRALVIACTDGRNERFSPPVRGSDLHRVAQALNKWATP